MCCREGVDKPPKPPKILTQPQPAPATGNNSTGIHKASSIRPPVQSKLPLHKLNHAGLKSRIERVDLAQESNQNDYANVGPRDYRNLHQLHEKVTKTSPVPTLGHTKPSFSYSKGEQPRLSYLNKGIDSTNHFGKSSSGYDDDWMDDLPSPSTLLGKKKAAETTTHWRNEIAAQSLVFDENMPDVEADMVGLSNLFALEDNPRHQAESATLPKQNEDFDSDISNYEDVDATWDLSVLPSPHKARGKTYEPDKAEKLFLSTDSPEKPLPKPMKRKAAALSDAEASPSLATPLQKQQKQGNQNIDTPESSTSANCVVVPDSFPLSSGTLEVQGGPLPSLTCPDIQGPTPPKPTIRPGYPAWVYDLDPEFVAEFEDCVDFE